MTEKLNKLCSLAGPSGFEDEVRNYIREHVADYADEIREDSIGNLIVFKKGANRRKKKLMVCAHMDEVGMIIKEVTADGYLKFDFVGGVDRRVAIGKRVLVGDKKIPGLIGLRAIHLTTKEERKKTPKLSELCIDIGCEKKSSAEKLVSPGDYAIFDSDVKMLSEHRIKARAIDDRAGCAVMLELLEEDLAYDTYFAFTVQEEVGCRGAVSASYSVEPDLALVIEGTTAADIPSSEGAGRVCSLANGAVIGCMDGSTIYDKKLFEFLRRLAEEKGIKWQMKSKVAGGTDAGKIHISKKGVRTTSLSVPTRYIHSPSCVADTRDMEAVLMLAREFINSEEEKLYV
ncbi:MAG: M42 family metallopeptidase [Oscillospiraceae bacterium]|nr:M42 family metallopeptidase [Oscillospiraceae bacterium]